MLFRELILEVSAALRQVQKEINPLERQGRNPVKAAVSATQRAQRSRSRGDINKAKQKHDQAIAYSQRRGLPRLVKQLKTHKGSLPTPVKPKKKKPPKRSP